MNRYNDWKNLLSYANYVLEKTGYSLLIVEPETGFYSCEIWKDGERVEVYAENYFEDELSSLVNDAFHYTFSKTNA